jgi:protein-S-isoprenylcysteine O-methyltransferase Ste14
MMVSAGVALRAAMVVGRHISPFPKPATGAVLRQHDVYGVVRHPMYSAVIIGTAGWAMFWRSRPGLLSIPPLALFFRLKSRHEERMLAATFPDYDEYMQRVPALIPRLGTRHR